MNQTTAVHNGYRSSILSGILNWKQISSWPDTNIQFILTLLRFSGVFSDPRGHKSFLILLSVIKFCYLFQQSCKLGLASPSPSLKGLMDSPGCQILPIFSGFLIREKGVDSNSNPDPRFWFRSHPYYFPFSHKQSAKIERMSHSLLFLEVKVSCILNLKMVS